MTRPSPATLIEHPAARIYDSTIPAIDITHLAEDPNTTATDFTHALVNTTINGHLCCICYLAFVSFIDLWLSLLARFKHLRGQRAYRLCDTIASFRSRNDALLFFDELNQLHSYLSFTMEEENNYKLPFFGCAS